MDGRITGREKQILNLIAQRMTNKQVSEKLGLSIYTIESHCTKIYRKLNVSDRFEAIEIAIKQGLIHIPLNDWHHPITPRDIVKTGASQIGSKMPTL